ncbi:MAG: pyruvate dehydrogenase, partial [Calditrichaeota bacterium]
SRGGATVIPMAGDVGSQYTPAAGWAQAILYRRNVLKESAYQGAIAAVLGGEGSVATAGFWSALTMATTLKLPLLFFIEDNQYAISVPGQFQTPGGNIAQNLASFKNLTILEGQGMDPADAAEKIARAVELTRSDQGPVLLRLRVPRLCGHSGQDTQTYKTPEIVAWEKEHDPLPRLKAYLVPALFSESEWQALEERVEREVREALARAEQQPQPDTSTVTRHRYLEAASDGTPELQQVGGMAPEGVTLPPTSETPEPEPTRINMVTAIRRTLEHELSVNPRLLIFGEDVGPKGGVHAVTLGLQEKFGPERVFDTSLSEEGIVGRAVGMALAGLMPVAEIQFRKYADPAKEQLNNCGTIRWRTNNRFAAPIVVRMPGGFFRVGDPWHSVCDEVEWIHAIGWQVAFPSNAEDAVGLLRTALRSNNPTIFFEHRHMLDSPWARRPYPGDHYAIPFGKAKRIREGNQLTVVSWGAMVERCDAAIEKSGIDAELIDLRTLAPWDRQAVLASVEKTRRCLIVHEDGLTAGFGAEIAATVVREGFFNLDAPVERLAVPDVPIPYNVQLMNAVVPTEQQIARAMEELVSF